MNYKMDDRYRGNQYGVMGGYGYHMPVMGMSGGIRNALGPVMPMPLSSPPYPLSRGYMRPSLPTPSRVSSQTAYPQKCSTPPQKKKMVEKKRENKKLALPPVKAYEQGLIEAIQEQQTWKERAELAPLLAALSQLSSAPLGSDLPAGQVAHKDRNTLKAEPAKDETSEKVEPKPTQTEYKQEEKLEQDWQDFNALLDNAETNLNRYSAALAKYAVAIRSQEDNLLSLTDQTDSNLDRQIERQKEIDQAFENLKHAKKERHNKEEYEKLSRKIVKNIGTKEAHLKIDEQKNTILNIRRQIIDKNLKTQRKLEQTNQLLQLTQDIIKL